MGSQKPPSTRRQFGPEAIYAVEEELRGWGLGRWKDVSVADRGDSLTVFIDVRDDDASVAINEIAARGYCKIVDDTIDSLASGLRWEAVIRQYGRTVHECSGNRR